MCEVVVGIGVGNGVDRKEKIVGASNGSSVGSLCIQSGGSKIWFTGEQRNGSRIGGKGKMM